MGSTPEVVFGSLIALAGVAWLLYWVAQKGPRLLHNSPATLVKAVTLRICPPVVLMVGGGVAMMTGQSLLGIALLVVGIAVDAQTEKHRFGLPPRAAAGPDAPDAQTGRSADAV